MEKVDRQAVVFAVSTPFIIKASNSGEDPTELLQGETKRYSGGFKEGGIQRGIQFEDETKVEGFEKLVGVSISSHEWRSKVEDFWANWLYHVPFGDFDEDLQVKGGKQIDAGYTVLSNGNIKCNNIQDYILYEMMIQDPVEVSTDRKDVKFKQMFKYFLLNKETELKIEKEVLTNKVNNVTKLAELFKDVDNTPTLQYLVSVLSTTYSSLHTPKLSRDKCIAEIFKIANEKPEQFIKYVDRKDLAQFALVEQLLASNIISKVANEYLYEGDFIGNKKSDIIKYLNIPDKSDTVRQLKAKLESYMGSMILEDVNL